MPAKTAVATRADIERLEKRIDECATKQDLERFATKQDLERFATKEALENLAAAMKIGFDDVHRQMAAMEARLDANLARAFEAALEHMRDWLRAQNDITRAMMGRVDRLEHRLDDHVADTTVHKVPRRVRR